jgi:hypothetical protein
MIVNIGPLFSADKSASSSTSGQATNIAVPPTSTSTSTSWRAFDELTPVSTASTSSVLSSASVSPEQIKVVPSDDEYDEEAVVFPIVHDSLRVHHRTILGLFVSSARVEAYRRLLYQSQFRLLVTLCNIVGDVFIILIFFDAIPHYLAPLSIGLALSTIVIKLGQFNT